jgi:hypothetical protein
MRTLVAGIVLILVGLAATEYSRRNPTPEEKKAAENVAPPKAPKPAEPPPTSQALLELSTDAPPAPIPADELAQEVSGWAVKAPSKDALHGVLAGTFAVRDVRAGPGFAVVAVEKDKRRALVKLTQDAAPQVLFARPAPLTAMALDGERLVWAEGGAVYSASASGGEVKRLVSLAKAQVLSLAVKGDLVLAALTPRDADPFAADPNGVIAKVEDGKVTVVSSDQVRPKDLLTDGGEAWWVAGYPSGLVRGALDGSFTARIVERADGPLAFDADGLVYRAPVGHGSEVRHAAKAGGSMRVVSTLDADALSASDGEVWFTVTGIAPHLYVAKAGAEPQDVMAFKGTVRGLAAAGGTVVLAVQDEAGVTSVRLK